MSFFQKLFKNNQQNDQLFLPLQGQIKNLQELNDDAFSTGALGDGFAIELSENKELTVLSPISGEVELIFPTKHAFDITTKNGNKVLIHIGIDTVNLDGKGFQPCVKIGSKIKHGQELVKVNFAEIANAGYKTDVIVLVLPESGNYQLEKLTSNSSDFQEPIFEIIKQ
ncbi:PTS sugar transporter subunit IIA [Mycoplasmopsis gallopavonis]|uniref:PTS system, glucose-specific IIABC component n=1 Tax=Mycoplasmopsis gallopavonis TaxID=76629 RepID=A0A449AZ52_9BACT|nr:PTS glucose transporter subunit IIA [Mycoplasmopsis gallopavonis]RIV16444.1 PTS glucose transporter subunit IIA [Mycoplasmopsis gallopavonis]VEU72829.1 PTS system, glucose-specific IIABC component [Mycoplasmopsis gallopavonis]